MRRPSARRAPPAGIAVAELDVARALEIARRSMGHLRDRLGPALPATPAEQGGEPR